VIPNLVIISNLKELIMLEPMLNENVAIKGVKSVEKVLIHELVLMLLKIIKFFMKILPVLLIFWMLHFQALI